MKNQLGRLLVIAGTCICVYAASEDLPNKQPDGAFESPSSEGNSSDPSLTIDEHINTEPLSSVPGHKQKQGFADSVTGTAGNNQPLHSRPENNPTDHYNQLQKPNKTSPGQSNDVPTKQPTPTVASPFPPTTPDPLPTCNLTLTNSSAEYFVYFLRQKHRDFAHLSFEFKNNVTIDSESFLILPQHWVWQKSFNVINYLQWPYDYPVLSFLLLRSSTRTPIKMVFDTYPSNCKVHFGKGETTIAIANALGNFTQDYLQPTRNLRHYVYSKWCFLEVPRGINDTVAYRFAKYIGWWLSYANYRCCQTRYDWEEEAICKNCSERIIKHEFEAGEAIVVASLILYAFFPLLLVQLFPRAFRSDDLGKCTNVQDTNDSSSSSQLANEDVTGGGTATGNQGSEWVYLNGEVPTNLSSLAFSMFGLEERYPIIVSRLRRFLLIVLMPIGIYMNVFLHILQQPDFTKTLLSHGAPVAFTDVFARDYGKTLFAPMFGGPIGVIALYHALGFLFVVGPHNLDNILNPKHEVGRRKEVSPLCLRLETIQMLSLTSFLSKDQRVILSLRLKAQFFMVWRPQFWGFVFKMQLQRLLDLSSGNARYRWLCFLLLGLATPLYCLVCLAEILLCIMFYGIPLIGFTAVSIYMGSRYISDKLRLKFRPLDVCFVVAMAIAGLVFLCTSSLIVCHTISALGRYIVFTYIAVIVYPQGAFGYVFFVSAILFYMFKLLSRIGQEYNDLLLEMFTICSRLDAAPANLKITGNTVKLSYFRDSLIKNIQINNTTVSLSEEQTALLHTAAVENGHVGLVHDNGLCSGIPRELFDTIVKKHKPLYIQVLRTLMRITVIIFLLLLTVHITNETGATDSLSDVMHVVFIVVMGALPHFLDIPHSKSTFRVEKSNFLKEIEQTIQAYVVAHGLSHDQ